MEKTTATFLYQEGISHNGSEMHKDSISRDDIGSSGILRQGVLVYYVGSAFFITGVALSALGVAFVMFFRIHYGSLPGEISLTVTFIGAGIILILTGINLMIRQTKYGYYVTGCSAFVALLAIPIFVYSYPDKWYYPLVNYVISLFVIGFLILLGNAFANVTIWMIEGKSEPTMKGEKKEKMRIYTDEEIERDIEEATKKSAEYAASKLEFTVTDLGGLTLGKAFNELRGNTTRVKDNIDEVKILRMTVSPHEVDKWGLIGIDKASMQLNATLEKQPIQKDRLSEITEGIEKKFKNMINLVKSKR